MAPTPTPDADIHAVGMLLAPSSALWGAWPSMGSSVLPVRDGASVAGYPGEVGLSAPPDRGDMRQGELQPEDELALGVVLE